MHLSAKLAGVFFIINTFRRKSKSASVMVGALSTMDVPVAMARSK
jgi:hypothetical protein